MQAAKHPHMLNHDAAAEQRGEPGRARRFGRCKVLYADLLPPPTRADGNGPLSDRCVRRTLAQTQACVAIEDTSAAL